MGRYRCLSDEMAHGSLNGSVQAAMPRAAVLLLSVFGPLFLAVPAHATNKAGIAVKDATWHVGASAGQFTDDAGPMGTDKEGEQTVDPHFHTTKKRISD